MQGVGFRYCTRAQARALGLSGWVRNRADGRVEAVLCGETSAVESMLAWCSIGPAGACVHNVQTQALENAPDLDTFEIR